MNEPRDRSMSDRTSDNIDEFKKRAQRISDRLDQADEILDSLQTKKKPDKTADTFHEIFDPIERRLRELLRNWLTEEGRPTDGQSRATIPRRFAEYLRACSDEQLAEAKKEIDRILEERGSIRAEKRG